MKIWTSEYELIPRTKFGVVASNHPRRGALLKVEDEQFGFGYADCHPWVELGDLPLLKQLKMLAAGKLTLLLERSLFFARIDAASRSAKRNLYSGLEIPQSHWLIPALKSKACEEIATAREQGFKTFKVKMGVDPDRERAELEKIVNECSDIHLRLDWNESGNAETLAHFFDGMSPQLREAIEFLEDPMEYDAPRWAALAHRYRVKCARDRGSSPEGVADVDVSIIKPAIQNPMPIVSVSMKLSRPVVFTSYLDHPLGQAAAAYAAALAKRNAPTLVSICGLVSHLVYEPNIFSETLSLQGATLIPPAGSGFGFDEQLERLTWNKLAP